MAASGNEAVTLSQLKTAMEGSGGSGSNAVSGYAAVGASIVVPLSATSVIFLLLTAGGSLSACVGRVQDLHAYAPGQIGATGAGSTPVYGSYGLITTIEFTVSGNNATFNIPETAYRTDNSASRSLTGCSYSYIE